MPRFLTGDELGNIKALYHSPDNPSDSNKIFRTLHSGITGGPVKSVQVLGVSSQTSSKSVVAGFSDGSATAFILGEGDMEEICSWKETRLRAGQRYIGLAVSERGIFSCTSNGALRLTALCPGSDPTTSLSALPGRLQSWHMHSGHETFAYGGDEVDLSVWNTEFAFAPHGETNDNINSKKRKRNALFPGEIWRANNVQNDSLGLRQPIRITSLTHLPSSSGIHLISGTQLGDVRRYDTRASRRPVSDWKISKAGGIKTIENGIADHQVFVSDTSSSLFSLDTRNGQIMYGYKGLAGAVTSMAPSPSVMASTALDRYARIHSTYAPPQNVGQQQERKGDVLDKVFMKSIPTVVVWDQDVATRAIDIDNGAEDDVWENMEHVGYTENVVHNTRTKRQRVD